MKNKIVVVSGIICMLIIGIGIGYNIKSNTVNSIASLKTNTITLASNKKKLVVQNKAKLDSERPSKSVLKSSDKGEDVTRIQTRLKKYGYNVVIDGDYGDAITYAVMDFQQRHNLVPSGTVSGKTLDALYKSPTKAICTSQQHNHYLLQMILLINPFMKKN
ncbi:peptidoglycan-binding domain-containing protein [Clostridium psychrophilum]|uniref:peptidoglycan-binding domain-containing protein n=1 Tax=Clostridium psychrophilum TaxID=132926 RepID=UPI001C0AA58B|nr:peptidoglycan-binding domain-containing protein [Clostridium psychrophilum]MBU3180879.1 peptidoglycan-binding protein [Clostridium psychrophilum]